MHPARWIGLGAALWLCPAVVAAGSVVEAWGEAQVHGDAVAAKKKAVADGLKRCIEQVVGITVKNDFSATMQETVKGNESQFNAHVRDTVLQNSEGFIDKYEVLEEKRDGDVIKVRVQARVFESKIVAQVKKLTELITAAGNPKLMVIIQEVTVAENGSRTSSSDSLMASLLEKELLARGVELIGKSEAKGVASKAPAEFDKWMASTDAVLEVGRLAGADLLAFGRLEIKNKGKSEDTGGFAALKGMTHVEIQAILRGVNVVSGAIFSSTPVTAKSFGNSLERAVHRALKGRSKNRQNVVQQTFDSILGDLKNSFQKTADEGRSYSVSVLGVKSLRRQGRRFLKILKGISGVSAVTQKSFRKGRLKVGLSCKCSPTELQDRIFDATEDTKGLDSLDLDTVKGSTLSFKL